MTTELVRHSIAEEAAEKASKRRARLSAVPQMSFALREDWKKKLQIPPLRSSGAPVEMTKGSVVTPMGSCYGDGRFFHRLNPPVFSLNGQCEVAIRPTSSPLVHEDRPWCPDTKQKKNPKRFSSSNILRLRLSNFPGRVPSPSGEIEQHHIRTLLHSFEDDFAAVRGDVEVANVEVGSEVGQLPLGAVLQVDEPEILVLNLSSQEHECRPPGRKARCRAPRVRVRAAGDAVPPRP